MRFRARQGETSIFELFRESADHLLRGSELLAVLLGPESDPREISAQMRARESAADDTNRKILELVNKMFMPPLDPVDIHSLAHQLDDIMDRMDEVAECIFLYRIDEFPQEFAEQVEILQKSAKLTAEAMVRLRSVNDLDDYCHQIRLLQAKSRQNHRTIVSGLFSGNHSAIELLKVKETVERLESSIAGFKTLAKTVEQISIKES